MQDQEMSEMQVTKSGRTRSGKARMDLLSAEQRSELARQAARSRWGNDADVDDPLVKATHGDTDHPLQIGETRIQCFVLENQTRVISQRGLHNVVGLSTSGGNNPHRMARFIESLGSKGVDVGDLVERTYNPIRFVATGSANRVTFGYEATMLPDLIHVVLDAHEANVLPKQYSHLVPQCRIMSRAFAKVGIVALVDEVTGYQQERASDALAELLRKYVSDELGRWVKTFPNEFYKELFRVYGWTYDELTSKRSPFIGKLTNDLVYERLAPEVLSELRARNPKLPSGRRKSKHFQWLTDDIGVPRLREHIFALITLLKITPSGERGYFYSSVERALPKWKDRLQGRLPGTDV